MADPGSTDPDNPTLIEAHDVGINTNYEVLPDGSNQLYYQWTAPADGKMRFDLFRSTLLDGTSGAIDGNDPYIYCAIYASSGGTPKDEWSGQAYQQIFGPTEGGLNSGDVVVEVTSGVTLVLQMAAIPHVDLETFDFTFGPVNLIVRASDFLPNIVSDWTDLTGSTVLSPDDDEERWVTPDYVDPGTVFRSGTYHTFGSFNSVDSDQVLDMSLCAWSVGRRAWNIGEPGTGEGSYVEWDETCPTPVPFELQPGSDVPTRMVGFSLHNPTTVSGLVKHPSAWANIAYCLVNVSGLEEFGEDFKNDIFDIPEGAFSVELQPVVLDSLGWRPDEAFDQDESYDHSTSVAWHLQVTTVRTGSEWGALPDETGTVEFWGNSTGASSLGEPLYLGMGGDTGYIDVDPIKLAGARVFEDETGFEGLLFQGLVEDIKSGDYPLMAGEPPEPNPPALDDPPYSRGRDAAIVVFRPSFTLTYRTTTVQFRPELWEDPDPFVSGQFEAARRRFWG